MRLDQARAVSEVCRLEPKLGLRSRLQREVKKEDILFYFVIC